MLIANPHCFWLLVQRVFCAFFLALARAGRSMPARMAIMAMTTSSSMSVKARRSPKREKDSHFTKSGQQAVGDESLARGGFSSRSLSQGFAMPGPENIMDFWNSPMLLHFN